MNNIEKLYKVQSLLKSVDMDAKRISSPDFRPQDWQKRYHVLTGRMFAKAIMDALELLESDE